jgi:hypothetical protein
MGATYIRLSHSKQPVPSSRAQIGILIDYGISDYQWNIWRMVYYIVGEQ